MTNTRITRRSDLLKDLLVREPSLKSLCLRCRHDEKFSCNTPKTYNIANTCKVKNSIARTLLKLGTVSGANPNLLETLFLNLTSEKTAVGYLAQFQVYDWLFEQGIRFCPEVEHANNIRGKSIELDGRIDTPEQTVYFDVKSSGFEPGLRSEFQKRLEENLPGYAVTISGPGNHSQENVHRVAFDKLHEHVAALRKSDQIHIEILDWSVEKSKRNPGVRFAENEYNMCEFVRNNRDVPLKYASQFVTDSPFILFFCLPDGVGSSPLKINVFGSLQKFAAGTAKHVFGACMSNQSPAVQFDSKVPVGVSVAKVVSKLSALVFYSPQASLVEIHLNKQADFPLDEQVAREIISNGRVFQYP